MNARKGAKNEKSTRILVLQENGPNNIFLKFILSLPYNFCKLHVIHYWHRVIHPSTTKRRKKERRKAISEVGRALFAGLRRKAINFLEHRIMI
jgi:hypothetical protein